LAEEDDTLNETAKATQEVAKTAGKAIDSVSEFGKFIARFIEGSLEAGVGIFEDKLRYMRWEPPGSTDETVKIGGSILPGCITGR
jgi:hypothetical protein